MMRIGIQGWGSEGDLRPLIALAAGLVRAGHAVRLDLTPIDGTDPGALCRSLEIPLRVIPERVDFSLRSVAEHADAADPLKVSQQLVEQAFFPYLDQLYRAALELCAQSDLVIWHYSSWYTKAAALKTGLPHVAVHFFPGLVPTRFAPPGGLPHLGALNPLLWFLARRVLDLQFRRRPARFFAEQGLPPLRHVLPDLMFSEHLNLHATSPLLCPPAPDWNPRHQVCGQLELPDAADSWTPSPGLRSFLEAGEKPVLLSLGSMEHMAPRRTRELLAGAARKARIRAIVQSKRSPAEEGRDGDLYFLPWAPHRALLRHCSMMVHHGGAGTTHSVLAAGLPAVVVPVIFEQQVWANRLRAAGASGKPVPFWKASVDDLANRILEVAASEAMGARARQLGAAMAAENGVETAIGLLERLQVNLDGGTR
ncbi:glycosyltransferase [Archangium sp. Cb G35]|uniref:glycosyltransferase n=1 Tax=Archangium sp. Cb G35 TaxID=1920190 RepID=UPI0011613D9A|nr:glycosyltransferase [Archangium sp. Cb G35]